MFRNYAFIILSTFTFYGCSVAQSDYMFENFHNDTIITIPNMDALTDVKTDTLMLQALVAQQNHEFEDAAKIYKELYDNLNETIYLSNAIKMSLMQNNLTLSRDLSYEGYVKYPDNNDMKRYYAAQLMKENKFDEAKSIAQNLVKIEKTEQNLKLLAAILFYQQNFIESLKFYNDAYKINKSEHTLLQIVDIHLKLNQKNKSISLLETNLRLNGCTVNTCSKLISIYAQDQNFNGLLSTYKKAYETFKDANSAHKIVEIYKYKGDIKGAISFLEQSGYSPETLIDLYAYQKDYKKAKYLSYKLYKETNNIDFLAWSTIFTYENSKDKKSVLKEVSDNFQTVMESSTNPLYQNYYGYLLIDHDIDIEKGIELVKKALIQEPESIYYLDSLAWGYYKLNRCDEALEIMESVYQNNKDEDEIAEHYNKIKECVKGNNR